MEALTEAQWQAYEKKYGKLMWCVARKIGLDPIAASPEDNYSDLVIAAMESILGFHKKTGLTFDQMIEEHAFNQYTKTCLWNLKNHKGSLISRKLEHRPPIVPIDGNEEVLQIKDKKFNFDFGLSISVTDDVQKRIVNLISSDPECLTSDGFINVSKVSAACNLTMRKTLAVILSLAKKLRNELVSN